MTAISVVVPVFNKKPHLQRSIGSILRQTYQDFELIAVDDASTDGSLEELERFTDPRIKILRRQEPGPGGYAARNLGAKTASSDWVAFLDADDEWSPHHLSEIIYLQQAFPSAPLVGTSWEVINDGETRYPSEFLTYMAGKAEHIEIDFGEFLKASADGRQPFWTSALAVKKDLLLKTGGFPAGKYRRGGDLDTWLRLMSDCRTAAWSSKITATYYRNSVNMVTKSEPFEITFEATTIPELIKKEPQPEVRALLKRFANTYLTSRFLVTSYYGQRPTGQIAKYLYLRHITFKQAVVLIASFLPKRIFSWIYGLYHRALSRSSMRAAQKPEGTRMS